jgi:N-acetylmuramoyl-L-alanine amidase
LQSRRVIAFAALILPAVITLLAQAPGERPAGGLTVVSREGRRSLPTRSVGGQEMTSLADLAAMFELAVHEDALADGLTVSTGGRSIILTPGQPLASVGGRLVSLPAAPLREGRTWLVPVEFINRALALISPTRLELRRDSRLVIAGDLRVPRVAVRHDAAGAEVRLTIDVSPRTAYTMAQERGRLLVRFDADLLDPRVPAFEPGLLVEALSAEAPATLAVRLGPGFSGYRVSEAAAQGNAARLVLDVLSATINVPAPERPVAERPPPEAAATPPSLDPQPPTSVRTIVIDPGHGGEDHGAKSASGATEKQVVLSVARRLRATIESRLGIRTLLTRDADVAVGLDERTAVANNNKADVFLSLHAGASVLPTVAGATVFSISLAAYGAAAQQLAAAGVPELPVFGGGSRPIEIIQWDLAQARHAERSALLAALVEEQLRSRVPMSQRPIIEAPLRVLVGANMAAVLIELGSLTNAVEAQRLAGDAYQTALVQALHEAVVRFRDRLDASRDSGGGQGRPIAGAKPVEAR